MTSFFERLAHGRKMDWDELLYGVSLVGRDFELVLRLGDLELMRGPMGQVTREGDEALFLPEWVTIVRKGKTPCVVVPGYGGDRSVRTQLIQSLPLVLPDTSIVILASDTPLCLIHPEGQNLIPLGIVEDSAQG